jgi:Domain of unknown function (DUF1844)
MAEEESFKVTDRRGREQERVWESTPGATAPFSTGPELAASRQEPVGRESRPDAAQPVELGEGQVDLQSLFVMFASSALVNLGEADPATGERQVDLDQARDAIDVLLLLRDKTAGNRTEHESRLLEQILYDVQMRYVRVAREAPQI